MFLLQGIKRYFTDLNGKRSFCNGKNKILIILMEFNSLAVNEVSHIHGMGLMILVIS